MTRSITTADVRRSRSIIEGELAQAQQTHDHAAYAAASDQGNEELRENLAVARRRIGVLTSELEGLEGVDRVARQREAEQDLAADVQRRAALFDEAQAQAAALGDAVQEVGELLAKVGELHGRILKHGEDARSAVIRASREIIQPKELGYLLASLVHQDIPYAWEGLLKYHSVTESRSNMGRDDIEISAVYMDRAVQGIRNGIQQTRESVLTSLAPKE